MGFSPCPAAKADILDGSNGTTGSRALIQILLATVFETRSNDFDQLHVSLRQALTDVSSESSQERSYAAALKQTEKKMAEFLNAQSRVVPQLTRESTELTALILKAEEALSKPENRTPELIKRLALGVVISTFFLALLRYLGNLYRTRYLQVLQAERDDFMVRRFYVVFKNSFASEEQRKAVLTGFMTIPDGASRAEDKESSDEATKQEFEVVKELVKALSKKL